MVERVQIDMYRQFRKTVFGSYLKRGDNLSRVGKGERVELEQSRIEIVAFLHDRFEATVTLSVIPMAKKRSVRICCIASI